MAIKAIVFDFWGTLVEQGTYSPIKQSYKILSPKMTYQEFVQKFEEVLMTKHYEDQKRAFEEVCKSFGIACSDFIISKLIGLWNKNKLLTRPYPETIDVLNALKAKGIKLGLISNSPAFSTEVVLEKFAIDKILDAVVLSCCNGALKQSGELLKKALELLKAKPEEALMVGDSIETDMEGARLVGVEGILIDRLGKRDWPKKIRNLKEIENFL